MTNDPCHEVAQALRAIGLQVEPIGDDLSRWRVNDEEMSDAGLMKLATLLASRTGLVDEPVSAGDDSPSVGGRALEALRAIAANPGGVRLTAYPRAMRTLFKLGYVHQRPARWAGARPDELGWFITPAGQELIEVLRAR